MGKRQHQKDKMYITCAEYTHFYGGKKPDIAQTDFRRLPFDHCSLSLQPFVYPVCTPEGVVFDLLNIVPWLKKYGTNPSNGEKLDGRSLIKLNFAKNSEGKYHCPVLFTVFTNNSHIVAIRTTGNVYAHEAVEQLNIKAKNFRDLLTDEPFSRQDIITLQDPTSLDKFNVSNFFHVKNNMKIIDPDEEKAKQDPSYYLKNTNTETRETLQELYKEFKGDEMLAATMKVPEKTKVDRLNAAHYSTGKVSASFTSTAMVPETTHEAAAIDEDVLRYQFVKKKGYVRLHTNLGDLNLELHCDLTPKTCENFIKLCKKQYYDGTLFHRSIRNFVIQGGDPTGTGTGGESYWGKPFRDEFRPNLSHTGRGVLSMANSGPNTNKSQFFITFRSCAYLDRKHTIFGRVVGGFDTLTAMENVESDPKTDRPKEEIRMDSTTVFVDPYEEADAKIAEERKKTRLEAAALESTAKTSQPQQGSQGPQTYRRGVGKYISPVVTKRVAEEEPSTSAAVPVAKKKPSRGFGDFSSW
ncbi:RING-type E3 ubiquitin-protein ligase PPIL2 isoform X1 [Monodon monoceros]|uniref:RING-type E3 ubiquitin-protein ligase PPIL2 n=2 Tax=Monodontidae TaxID=9747 RepID=A0A2Y9LB21_DELLE|nr:RING-type E3 ubiquitin-protein ligase PPIL2 isoform X1 [Delphinapterus leucas]XP_022406880.1 RING-type E3 ubiquitin-protein ligase PPIL2 isoform X1 [Delphinapterus leucas]XP_029079984.1 RING-type E3 ubiquitin-protein ligase PPIL2 isoform X1 [Monodon monoceros]